MLPTSPLFTWGGAWGRNYVVLKYQFHTLTIRIYAYLNSPASLAHFFFCDPYSTIGVAFKWNLCLKICSQTVLPFSRPNSVSAGFVCSLMSENALANTGEQREHLSVLVARSEPCSRSTQQLPGCPASCGISITTFLACLMYSIKVYFALLLEHHQRNLTQILVSGILFPVPCLQGAAAFLELRLQTLRQIVTNHTEAL